MAYIEDILPQIRKGRKARRKEWSENWHLQKDGDFLDLIKNGQSIYFDTLISFLKDDWELVPEPVKHKVIVYLWGDGVLTTYGVRMSEKDAKLIETREIEWSVE